MEVVARKLVEWNPDPGHLADFAYATRRAKSFEAAYPILTRAAELHPNDALIQFNLACYEAHFGNLAQGKLHLTRATALDPRFCQLAVDDPDLEPLWNPLSYKLP